MAILKCKMGGGDILLSEDKTTGTCDHCGSTMTFPRVSDEQKLNLYNRANHFRRQNEFDKAITAYERILDQDDTDAEAHWGAVLSRYGIEYVEDPITHERIPTCHRVQISSILSDGDYLAALENAPDTASRALYEQEAHRIAEIQKGILSISSQEKPYDVFICYKETDEAGRRTRDSALAQEIYYQLTNEGYKVFFSRITLEDKLGQQYEPYIFAALNSAKVMLVVGTKSEYFNAVWVKNEWSRYLALMKNDRSRLLIPCYRDMDPYDLPEELSALQSQDMSKIGFMQDLIRGVKKVLNAQKLTETKPAAPQVTATGANIENLMKRAYLFMEDGDFASANEYLDKVLDENAEYAPAYAGKVCTYLGLRKEADLAAAPSLYSDHPDWKKALRFASPHQRTVYEKYYEQVQKYINQQIQLYAFDCAVELAVNPKADRVQLDQELIRYQAACQNCLDEYADRNRRKNASSNEAKLHHNAENKDPGDVSEQAYRMAEEMFLNLSVSSAPVCAEECRILAEKAQQKVIYDQAMKQDRQYFYARHFEELADRFMTVADYKDARIQAQKCLEQADSMRKKLYDNIQNAMQKAGNDTRAWKAICDDLTNPSLDDYNDVANLRNKAKQRYQESLAKEEETRRQLQLRIENEEKYAAAIKKKIMLAVVAVIAIVLITAVIIISVIIPKGHYDKGIALRDSKQWEEAIAEFEQAGGYSDAKTQILATRYAEGEAKRTVTDWDGAVKAFEQADDYNDAKTQVLVTRYAEGEAKRTALDWDGAVKAFEQAGSYIDAKIQIQETYYQEANLLEKAGNQAAAKALFIRLGNYRDSYERTYKTYYDLGMKLQTAQDWNGAVEAFEQAGDYSDAKTQILATRYAEGNAKLTAHDWEGAIIAFELAGDYSDAKTQIKNICTQQASGLETVGKKPFAALVYSKIGNQNMALSLWQEAGKAPIAAGGSHTVRLKADGTVIAMGLNLSGQCNVHDWTDIVSVAAGGSHTVGLKADGTVVAVGSNDAGRCSVQDWSDIVAVAAGNSHTVGLKADGTVVAVGQKDEGQCNVQYWAGIVAVAAGSYHTVGLKADGHVVTVGTGRNGFVNFTQDWTDIVAIAAGNEHIVGLKLDGTVVATGRKDCNQCDVQDWTDIVAVAAGGTHTVGLKVDGTVVAVGSNVFGQCNVQDWSNIVAVAAGGNHTVGLKEDGTLVVVGFDSQG